MSEFQYATCHVERVDPEVFFPVDEDQRGSAGVALAVTYCRRCPVRDACLARAMDGGYDVGVFGGLTGVQRRRLRMPAAARHAADAAAVRAEQDPSPAVGGYRSGWRCPDCGTAQHRCKDGTVSQHDYRSTGRRCEGSGAVAVRDRASV